MNVKGQTVLGSIVMGIMLFMAGMIIMNFILSDIDTARTALSCTDSTISDGSKLLCLGTDAVAPYAIITIISIAGGILLSKFII